MALGQKPWFGGRVALVTGAASGLCADLARRLAGAGTRTVLFACAKAGLHVLRNCEAAVAVHGDVTVAADVARAVEAAGALGPLSFVAAAAGIAAEFAARHPLGRFGRPAGVTEAALFLPGNGDSFITGAAMPVDGGRLA